MGWLIMADYKGILRGVQGKRNNSIVAPYPKNRTANGMKGGRQRFEISSVIDEFSAVNNSILVNDGDPTMFGTAIPYLYNLYSDLVVNPSSVSVSEFQKMAYSQPVLSNGLTLLFNLIKNEIDKYSHEKPLYKDFINDMFANMDRSFDAFLTDLLTALYTGFYVGEKKLVSDGRFQYVQDIQPRPAQSIIYRVDSQGKLKDDGIIQYYFNNLWTGYGNLLAFNQVGPGCQQRPNPYASIGDFDYPWRTVWAQPIGTVIIPKDKCVHFAYKGLDGLDSPYGRSLLRSAYDSYLVRAEMTKITRNAANNKASKIPFITVDPSQTATDEGQEAFDQLGETLRNLGGNQDGSNPFVLLQGRQGESVWIDGLDSTANLDQFINMNKYFDGQMLLSTLFQADLMGLSDKGAYALGETQQDLVGRNVNAIVEMVKGCIIDQVVKPALMTNFNEKDDFGTFDMKDNVAEDVALNLDKLNSLRDEGVKLTTEAVLAMMDISKDALESDNNPPPSQQQGAPGMNNSGVNSNFKRAQHL
jgi:hypothetical protein